ncbi:MAG: TRAP transporter substrate-binding protein DctP [Deltaproteobacteria bacterium]|nr:TRAP transporter substrate-binding protein DctP [Deltaproteobacteria bacterium]
MKKRFLGIMIAAVFMFSMWSPKTMVASAEPVVLKLASFEPPQGFNVSKVFIPLVEKINQDGKGVIKIETFFGGTLGRDVLQQLQLLKDGVADIVHIVNAYHPGQLVDDQVVNTPFMAEKCLDCTLAVDFLQKKNLMRGYDDLVIIGQICLDQYNIHTNFPVKVPSDLKNRKIRTAGKMQHALVLACGGTPIAMPITKVAENISRGVIEGTISDWNGMQTFRINDVAKYHCQVRMGTTLLMLAMMKKKYESLPAEARAVLDRYRGKYTSVFWAERMDEAMDGIRKKITSDPEHELYKPTAEELEQWKAALNPVIESWDKENERWDELIRAYEKGLTLAEDK